MNDGDDELKLMVYNKLNNNKNNSNILDFIINNISHTKNSNGLFLNISSLSHDNLVIINNILDNISNNQIPDIDYQDLIIDPNIKIEQLEKTEVTKYKTLKLINLEKKIFTFTF